MVSVCGCVWLRAACEVRGAECACVAAWQRQVSIAGETALPYIPEAVPREPSIAGRRARGGGGAGLRSRHRRATGWTRAHSAKTGPLSAADGCDVAAAGSRTKDPRHLRGSR